MAGCRKSNKMTAPVISTNPASSITSTTALVGGTITNTGGSTITKSGICYAIHTNPSITDSLTTDGGMSLGSFKSTLSNLNPNTTYYYCAYAINATGTSLGTADSFVTSKGVPTLTTVGITNNADLQAQSGGTIINNGGATITASGVCWSTAANPTISNFKVSNPTQTGSFFDTLRNLTVQTTYYVRAFATNSYGTGYGNQITFSASSTGTVTDFDGNVYGTITIGTQTWLASNLRVRHYRNGDSIRDGFVGFDLLHGDSVGAYTFPNGDTSQASLYGLYYTYGALADSRNIAPTGWHVATDQDWYKLEFYEGLTSADTMSNSDDLGLRGTVGGKFLVGGSSGLNLQLAGYYCPACGDYTGSFNQFGVYLCTPVLPAAQSCYFRAFNLAGPDAIYRAYANYPASVRLVKD